MRMMDVVTTMRTTITRYGCAAHSTHTSHRHIHERCDTPLLHTADENPMLASIGIVRSLGPHHAARWDHDVVWRCSNSLGRPANFTACDRTLLTNTAGSSAVARAQGVQGEGAFALEGSISVTRRDAA